jgi:hypothetical protein
MIYNYEIKYKELQEYLETLSRTDFEKGGIIKPAYTIRDKEVFKYDLSNVPSEEIVQYNQPYLRDALGNDLSVVVFTKRKYRLPTGYVIRSRFDRTIIEDCLKTYGSYLNGYWLIPKEFIVYV